MAFSQSGDNTDGLFTTKIVLDYCLDIYYKNVRGLMTKYVDFYYSVSSMDYKIICLTKTWLIDSVFTHNIFPSNFKLFRANCVFGNFLEAVEL
jgi:hypothetical protein